MQSIQLILVGLAAGICSGVFGIGGGVIIVPMLTLLLHLPQQTAVATSLVALLLPVGALGAWTYYQAGSLERVHVSFGLTIACGLFIGAALGARLALPVPEIYLRRGFAVFLLLIGARMWLK